MTPNDLPKGYMHRILRVDLTNRKISTQNIDPLILKQYIGGTGLGAKLLYEEVSPSVKWSDPENRLVFATGPLNGTRVPGSGTYSVVTKGCLSQGATSCQANGFFGAYLKFSGFDGIAVEGASKDLVYLYVHDDTAEFREARHLAGKDTWETEELIRSELGKAEHEISIIGIGPAGENLVRFGAIVGDHGHVAGHNGVGAVMGSKRLKAIATARKGRDIPLDSKEKIGTVSRGLIEKFRKDKLGDMYYQWGTNWAYAAAHDSGWLPVKNYTTNIFPEYEKFTAEQYRKNFKIKRQTCWACQLHHLHIMEVPDGPYAGYVGEEPDYEQWAAWGSLIGNKDVAGAFVLSNEVDRLGMENNEAGWIVAWLMECFEKGILTERDCDGIEMRWGNVEATRAMLRKIAHRQGVGDLLAEGIKHAAQQIGGEAEQVAIYTLKGHSPRTHDHRVRWPEMLDTITSSTGTIETGPVLRPADFGLPNVSAFSLFEPDAVAELIAKAKARMPFYDSLVVCNIATYGDTRLSIELLNAATGWSFSFEDMQNMGLRVVNLLRAFNIRCGITPDVEYPSARYSSVPTDGPLKGTAIAPVWERMVATYYWHMGWDRRTGKPLPITLKRLGLEEIINDLW